MRTEKPRYHTSSCRLRDIDKQYKHPSQTIGRDPQYNFISYKNEKSKEWSKTESGCDLQKNKSRMVT